MRFATHGQLVAKKEGNILVIEGTGPWNIEMLLSANNDAKGILSKLYEDSWGVLSIMHGEAAYLPDAAAKLVKIISEEKSKHRIATAVVLSDERMSSFAQGHLSQIYQKAGETVAFFKEVDTAQSWLKDKLREAKKTS